MRGVLWSAGGAILLGLAGWSSSGAQELPTEFRNLQVLDQEIELEQLKKIMNGFTEQLDVKCSFCHVVGEYHLDDLDHKKQARKMIRLVQYLQASRELYFEEDTKSELLACGTCHRGKAEIEPYNPDYEDWP